MPTKIDGVSAQEMGEVRRRLLERIDSMSLGEFTVGELRELLEAYGVQSGQVSFYDSCMAALSLEASLRRRGKLPT